MTQVLMVTINGELALNYDRNRRIPGRRRDFLDFMDRDMDAGIQWGGQRIERPNAQQRARYISMHLVRALLDRKQAQIAAMSTYLAHRHVNLKEVRAEESGNEVRVELIYEEQDI